MKIDDIKKRIEDPLFVLAIVASLIPVVRLLLPAGSIYLLIPVGLALLGVIMLYFAFLSLKREKNKFVIGIPLVVFCIALFLHYSNTYGGGAARDYNVFALCGGFVLFFYALSAYGLLPWNHSLVFALFLTALATHVVTARAPFIAEIDPYWFYKFGQGIYNAGHVPERDNLVYPLWGGMNNPTGEPAGIDFSAFPFFNSVFMAFSGFVLKPLGFSLIEAAILYPGVVSAFTIVFVYLIVVAMFSENRPYNHIAGALAAFMVMFSPAFSFKAIATNTEDDVIGMLLLTASFFLFVKSYQTRSRKLSILSALSFTLFSMAWIGGFTYAVVVLSFFSAVFALISYLKKKSCIEHIPYMIVSIVPAPVLAPFVLHARGSLPKLSQFVPDKFIIVGIGGAIVFSLFLELIRARKHGKIMAHKDDGLAPLHNLIENNIRLFSFSVVVILAALSLYLGPKEIYSFIIWRIIYAKSPPYLIGRTIAEQNPLATSIPEFLAAGTDRFGVSLTFGLLMIIPMLYLAFAKRNIGAVFILCWSLPMLYGSYYKSQFLFNASVPIAILAATIGLFSVAKLKDFETLRVIGAILVLSTPFLYIPFFGSWNYDKFPAYIPMNVGVGADNYYWDSALQWFKNETPGNSAVLTWWDYGHWITAVSHRHVLIDNLQADHYQLQDIARFFVNATDEESAFKIVKAYQDAEKKQGVDLRYVAIDWTMIGKGSALHYIATGTIDPFIEGSWKNYAYCYFSPQSSDTSPKIVPNANGTISYVQDIIFACTNYVPLIKFRVQNNRITNVTVLDRSGGEISWEAWSKQRGDSLLGLYPPGQIVGLAKDRPFENILPTLRAFVYVPGEFNDFLMTRLYFGEYLDSYKAMGLYKGEVEPLAHFKLVQDFVYGYVRVYEIIDEPAEPQVTLEPLNITLT